MHVSIKGNKLICPICRCEDFSKRHGLINTRGMSLLGLDWANQGTINYICENCGYIFPFIDDGSEYIEKYEKENQTVNENIAIDYETSKAEEDECPICFSKLGKNDKECSSCGHIVVNKT